MRSERRNSRKLLLLVDLSARDNARQGVRAGVLRGVVGDFFEQPCGKGAVSHEHSSLSSNAGQTSNSGCSSSLRSLHPEAKAISKNPPAVLGVKLLASSSTASSTTPSAADNPVALTRLAARTAASQYRW
eukprot:scaffold197683_cov31-Tisochrysis_lutea.AAC.1